MFGYYDIKKYGGENLVDDDIFWTQMGPNYFYWTAKMTDV